MGVLGAVTTLLAEALPSFHFKSDHFITFHQVVQDFGFHHRLHCRTREYGTAVVGHQYFGEFHLITGVSGDMRYIQAVAGLYFKLLTGYFYYC